MGLYKTTVIVEAYQSNKEFDMISETGREHVNVGDWIVRDLETYEEHPCDQDTFQKKYELIDENTNPLCSVELPEDATVYETGTLCYQQGNLLKE